MILSRVDGSSSPGLAGRRRRRQSAVRQGRREGVQVHFGVSNQTPGQVELLKRSVKQPLAFNQVQLSITHSPLIAAGIATNMAGLDQ